MPTRKSIELLYWFCLNPANSKILEILILTGRGLGLLILRDLLAWESQEIHWLGIRLSESGFTGWKNLQNEWYNACMSYAYKKEPRTSVLIMLQSCEFKNSWNSDSDRKGLGFTFLAVHIRLGALVSCLDTDNRSPGWRVLTCRLRVFQRNHDTLPSYFHHF